MRCRSCKRPVLWTVTAKDAKRMPVDPQPVENGNIELQERPGKPPLAHYVPTNAPNLMGTPRHVSHFATCPDRDQWRKK